MTSTFTNSRVSHSNPASANHTSQSLATSSQSYAMSAQNLIQRSKEPIQLQNLPRSTTTTPVKQVNENNNNASFNRSVNNVIIDETMMSDDLSTLPAIDDRTLSLAIKAKYDAKKFYVSFEYLHW
jgi:hypothetical protein